MNRAYPDQTSEAVWSGSVLFASAILSETFTYKILGHLLYQTNKLINTLTLSMLVKISADNILKYSFLFLPRKKMLHIDFL